MKFYVIHPVQWILFYNVSTDYINFCPIHWCVRFCVGCCVFCVLYSIISFHHLQVFHSSSHFFLFFHLHMPSHMSSSYKVVQPWMDFGLLHNLPPTILSSIFSFHLVVFIFLRLISIPFLPSLPWSSLWSCAKWFPIGYGFDVAIVCHSFYMAQPSNLWDLINFPMSSTLIISLNFIICSDSPISIRFLYGATYLSYYLVFKYYYFFFFCFC